MSKLIDLRPAPSAHTLRRFAASNAPVRALMGPVGGGKTLCCLSEFLRRAVRQAPSKVDGVRRSKWAAIRDTYRNLDKTTIPSWHKIMPKERGVWKGGSGEPAEHRIQWTDKNFGKVDITVQFIALGEHNVEEVLKGLEVTGGYLNEADGLSDEVLPFLRGRLRFPDAAIDGPPTWAGVWLDFNAPDVDSWIYNLFIENKPDEFDFFAQPSALSPQAENIEYLPPGYYETQMTGQPDWYVRRMLRNQFGFSRAGRPVYPDFNDQVHVASAPLRPMKNKIVKIGFDAGRTPAAVLTQTDDEGQLRVLDEFLMDNAGAKKFAQHLSRFLAANYAVCDFAGVCDPAAENAGDQDEASWMEIVANELQIEIIGAPSNIPTERWGAVERVLREPIAADKPAFVLSPVCKVLRRGFNSNYRFKKRPSGGYEDRAEKNDESHPHDALQYAALDATDFNVLMGRSKKGNFGKTREELDYDPLG